MSRIKNSGLPLCLTVFNDYLGFAMTLTIFAPLLFNGQDFGLTTFKEKALVLGFLLASYPLMQFFSAPFIGGLSDRYGRKPVLLVTLFISALCYMVGGLAITNRSLFLLFVARLVGGMLAGNVTTAQAAVADMSTASTKTRNMVLLTASVGGGFIVGAVVGGRLTDQNLISWFNFATPFWFVALLFFINFCLIALAFRETHSIKPPFLSFRVVDHINKTIQTIKMADLRPYFIIFFLSALAINFFVQFGSAFLRIKFQMGAPLIGNYYGLLIFGFLLSTLFLIKWFSKSFSLKAVAIGTLFAMTVLTALTTGMVSIFWLALPFFLYGICNGLFNACIYPMVSGVAHKEDQGKAFGVLTSMNSFAQVFAPIISGYMIVYHPDVPLLFSSVLFLISALVALFSLSSSRH